MTKRPQGARCFRRKLNHLAARRTAIFLYDCGEMPGLWAEDNLSSPAHGGGSREPYRCGYDCLSSVRGDGAELSLFA